MLGPTSDIKPCSDTGILRFCKLVSRRHPDKRFRIFTQGAPCGSRGLEFATSAFMELSTAQKVLYGQPKRCTRGRVVVVVLVVVVVAMVAIAGVVGIVTVVVVVVVVVVIVVVVAVVVVGVSDRRSNRRNSRS